MPQEEGRSRAARQGCLQMALKLPLGQGCMLQGQAASQTAERLEWERVSQEKQMSSSRHNSGVKKYGRQGPHNRKSPVKHNILSTHAASKAYRLCASRAKAGPFSTCSQMLVLMDQQISTKLARLARRIKPSLEDADAI